MPAGGGDRCCHVFRRMPAGPGEQTDNNNRPGEAAQHGRRMRRLVKEGNGDFGKQPHLAQRIRLAATRIRRGLTVERAVRDQEQGRIGGANPHPSRRGDGAVGDEPRQARAVSRPADKSRRESRVIALETPPSCRGSSSHRRTSSPGRRRSAGAGRG